MASDRTCHEIDAVQDIGRSLTIHVAVCLRRAWRLRLAFWVFRQSCRLVTLIGGVGFRFYATDPEGDDDDG